MAAARNRLWAGIVTGAALGVALVGVLRSAAASPEPGSGDPPVIVLPSARAVLKQGDLTQVQATQPPGGTPVMPKLELLPPPTPEPQIATSPAPPPTAPIAPPLLTPGSQDLQTTPSVPTLSSKEVPGPSPISANEVAPQPREAVLAAAPVQEPPTPGPGAIPPPPPAQPGESTMLKSTTAAAAALSAMIAGSSPAAETTTPPPLVDPARAADVMSLRSEIQGLRGQMVEFSRTAAHFTTATDLNAVREELNSLRQEIAKIAMPQESPTQSDDLKALKDEIASLKTQIANMAQPGDAKAVKDEIDALRKDVQTLTTLLREALDGKVDKGFTHDGIVKRLQRLDESVETLTKRLEAIDSQSRTAGASPLAKPAATAARGVVRIVNEYPIEISIAVNGVAYRLEPSARRDVDVAEGSFKYQLITSGGSETERSIREGETVTLTIR